ncbi:EGF-like repeat and discoidin I-like domain-containing protein 3 [Actinia tenebrosa]|uniref:EGF-like repeat and discoidin I-like domain-containing protein 3 n=1 Tax=Actinia tenebrosa TaxID=6105 RepID=A0A6P8IZD8_ACTTE|nr:EGF-like repeat and discoidin I-like domain-containing protein 3 [Actinia tenebrosa]
MTSPHEAKITCFNNSPCKNGGTCLVDSSVPVGYRCTCTLFNTGLKCENWTAAHCNGLPLGLEDKRIADSQLSASSVVNNYHHPKYARLNALPGSDHAGSWRGASRNGEYFQVDLLTTKMITKFATQGRPRDKYNRNQWISKFSLTYSVDGSTWVSYRGDGQSTKIFNGNSDKDTIVSHSLGVDVPIVARYIRIVVQAFVESPSLRAELYGCNI